jgi:hypothetical protein
MDKSDPDKVLVRQLLKNTNLETRDLQVVLCEFLFIYICMYVCMYECMNG